MYPHESKDLPHATGNHTFSRKEGYQAAEYQHQEYPKAMDAKATVIMNSKEEEDAFLASKKAAAEEKK